MLVFLLLLIVTELIHSWVCRLLLRSRKAGRGLWYCLYYWYRYGHPCCLYKFRYKCIYKLRIASNTWCHMWYILVSSIALSLVPIKSQVLRLFHAYRGCVIVFFFTSDNTKRPGGWFNIKMWSYQYRQSHCGDKTILRPSYLHNGISYTGKTAS